MAFFKEFKEFALKGNVMDMAVGVIIGGAFGKIVSSLGNDVLMPPIGVLIGNADFSNLKLDISRVRDAVAAGTDFLSHDTAAAAAYEPVPLKLRPRVVGHLDGPPAHRAGPGLAPLAVPLVPAPLELGPAYLAPLDGQRAPPKNHEFQ